MDTTTFDHSDWTSIWAGLWSLLTCSFFAEQYTRQLMFGEQPFMSQSIIFVGQGRSAAWMRQADKDRLGHYLADKVRKDPQAVTQLCAEFKALTDSTLGFMQEYQGKVLSQVVFQQFIEHVLTYYKPHISVKYVVDYLEPELLEKYLPQLEEARVYAEPVFEHLEQFVIGFAKEISLQTSLKLELILCLSKDELFTYFQNGGLPPAELLGQRNMKAALITDSKEQAILVGDARGGVESLVDKVGDGQRIQGMSAYKGIVTGVVRVVIDPTRLATFNKGDILVTGMTRPEFLPLMHKAAAFVTDAGGILSHAAITARELKKPCVIGTKVATKVLKDGDKVEVDANQGIVTKI